MSTMVKAPATGGDPGRSLPRTTSTSRNDLQRQVAHWLAAAATFHDAEQFASAQAWRRGRGTGRPARCDDSWARASLASSQQGRAAGGSVRRARTDGAGVARAASAVQAFRRSYSQVETTLEFFGNAVNSRTSPGLGATLQTLDRLAGREHEPGLTAGQASPPVLCYVGQGMGASIIRAGVRLWDPGTVNPVAAIKIVRHNLYRPTSLFHETRTPGRPPDRLDTSVLRRPRSRLADDPARGACGSLGLGDRRRRLRLRPHRLRLGLRPVRRRRRRRGDPALAAGRPAPIGWLRTMLGSACAGTCLRRRAVGPAAPGRDDRPPALARRPDLGALVERSMQAMAASPPPVSTHPSRRWAAGRSPRSTTHCGCSPAPCTTLERTGGGLSVDLPALEGTEGIRTRRASAGLPRGGAPRGRRVDRPRPRLAVPTTAPLHDPHPDPGKEHPMAEGKDPPDLRPSPPTGDNDSARMLERCRSSSGRRRQDWRPVLSSVPGLEEISRLVSTASMGDNAETSWRVSAGGFTRPPSASWTQRHQEDHRHRRRDLRAAH